MSLVSNYSNICNERRKSSELRSHMRIDKYIPLTKINYACILYSIISLCRPRSKGNGNYHSKLYMKSKISERYAYEQILVS